MTSQKDLRLGCIEYLSQFYPIGLYSSEVEHCPKEKSLQYFTKTLKGFIEKVKRGDRYRRFIEIQRYLEEQYREDEFLQRLYSTLKIDKTASIYDVIHTYKNRCSNLPRRTGVNVEKKMKAIASKKELTVEELAEHRERLEEQYRRDSVAHVEKYNKLLLTHHAVRKHKLLDQFQSMQGLFIGEDRRKLGMTFEQQAKDQVTNILQTKFNYHGKAHIEIGAKWIRGGVERGEIDIIAFSKKTDLSNPTSSDILVFFEAKSSLFDASYGWERQLKPRINEWLKPGSHLKLQLQNGKIVQIVQIVQPISLEDGRTLEGQPIIPSLVITASMERPLDDTNGLSNCLNKTLSKYLFPRKQDLDKTFSIYHGNFDIDNPKQVRELWLKLRSIPLFTTSPLDFIKDERTEIWFIPHPRSPLKRERDRDDDIGLTKRARLV